MTLDQLKRMRLAKKRPFDFVVVSMIGRIAEIPYPVIVAQRGSDYSPLYGLEVFVAHIGKNIDSVINLASDIAAHYPYELECWNVLTGQMISVITNYRRYIREVPPI